MPDWIIDAPTACSVHAEACRSHTLVSWIVIRGLSHYPNKVAARLVTDAATPYVLLAETLAEVRAKLPPGLVRSEGQPIGSPEVVEVWFSA